jgi:spore maturation protein CgeB
MNLKSILILGAFNPGAIENFYKQGFEKFGITVDTYGIADQYYAFLNKGLYNKVINKLSPDFFYAKINKALLGFIDKKHYDVILVFKGMELFPETVKQLKDHAILTANYNADHPFVYYAPGSGNHHVLDSIPHYDVHFSYAKKIVDQLQNSYNKQAYCIPFGYDSRLNTTSPGETNQFKDRFLFIGAFDKQRARYLYQLQSDSLDIYGEQKWSSRNVFRPYLKKAYKNSALYGNEYVNAITTSLGILNLIRQQNMKEDSHNMRTFEVPGYGGLLVSQRTTEQLEYFEEGKEAVFFDSVYELQEKMLYLSANTTVVNAMKQAAYNRSIRADYSYDQRSRQLLDCLKNIF